MQTGFEQAERQEDQEQGASRLPPTIGEHPWRRMRTAACRGSKMIPNRLAWGSDYSLAGLRVHDVVCDEFFKARQRVILLGKSKGGKDIFYGSVFTLDEASAVFNDEVMRYKQEVIAAGSAEHAEIDSRLREGD